MKKIVLDVETLAVDSFEVSSGMDLDRGTVEGNQGSLNDACYSKVGSCARTACCPETTIC